MKRIVPLFFVVLLCALSVCSFAQQICAPVAGIVLDRGGRLHTAAGVFTNLLPPRPLFARQASPALTLAASDSAVAWKTADRIFLTDMAGNTASTQSAPVGSALFSFDAQGTPAFAWFAGSRTLRDLKSGTEMDGSAWGESVIALGPAGRDALDLIASSGGSLALLTVSLSSAEILATLPIEGAAPAAWFEGGWLVSAPDGLAWRSADGSAAERRITTQEAPVELETAGLHSIALNRRWLIGPAFVPLRIPSLERSNAPVREARR